MTKYLELTSLLALYKPELSDNQYSKLLIGIRNGDFLDESHLLAQLDQIYKLNPSKARENWRII